MPRDDLSLHPAILDEISRTANEIRDLLGDDFDADTLLDTLDGETDVMDLIGAMLRDEKRDNGVREALKAEKSRLDDRDKAFADRVSRRRVLLGRVLDAMELTKVQHPLATVSRTKPRERVVIGDVNELPQGYYRNERKALSKEIRAALDAGEAVPGAWLETGEPGVMVRG